MKGLSLLFILLIPGLLHAHDKYGPSKGGIEKCFTNEKNMEECTSPSMAWSESVNKFLESQILYFYAADNKMCTDQTPEERLRRFKKSEYAYLDFLTISCKETTPYLYGRADRHQKNCFEEGVEHRRKYLLEKLESNFSIDYCDSISGKVSSVYLKTKKFNIKITKNCEDNYYLCDDVDYVGIRKSDGASLELSGGFFLEGDVHSGYEFIKKSLTYRVYFNGTLEVKNKHKVLFSEVGKWHQWCDECKK